MAREPGSNDQLARLYRAAIKRHAADPVGYRQAIEASHRHELYNPLCGDRVEISLRVQDGQVEAAAFDGEACAICRASASLLCSLAPGEPVSRVMSLGSDLQRALGKSRMNPLPQDGAALRESRMDPLPQELRPLLGVRPYPSRVRCATLPWEAAIRALTDPRAT
jgi:nitrogen fixation NifU-like protein